jgi:hypothetical protein
VVHSLSLVNKARLWVWPVTGLVVFFLFLCSWLLDTQPRPGKTSREARLWKLHPPDRAVAYSYMHSTVISGMLEEVRNEVTSIRM